LEDFPETQLTVVRDHANADYNRFKAILDFDPGSGNPTAQRNSLIQQIRDSYQGTFNAISSFIAYGATKATDFRRLESDARAAVQAVEDNANKVARELEAIRDDAKGVLEEVRKATPVLLEAKKSNSSGPRAKRVGCLASAAS
jgi:DNA repair ATPase RecN